MKRVACGLFLTMFGSIYTNHSEILLDSFHDMNTKYHDVSSNVPITFMKGLQALYIRIFGIPEIGFQVRGMYFRKALRTITNFKPTKILDAGCGIGSYVYYVAMLYPNTRIDGWEIDRKKLAFAKNFFKDLRINNVHFTYGDITKKQEGSNVYDFIMTIDVLEHIKDYRKALKNFYTLLKSGGYVYIHTPQIHQKRFFSQFKSWEHIDHVREGFEPKKLSADLEKIGFKVISLEHTFGFFGSLAWELNHLLLSKSFVLAGLAFPILYILALMDRYTHNYRGLAASYLAQKP